MATKRIVGLDNVLRNLNREVRKIKGKTKKGIIKATLLVKREAMKITPVDTGNLVNSAFSNVMVKGKDIVGTIGYTAAYAAAVHEMIESKSIKGPGGMVEFQRGVTFQKPGAQAKFLETPLKKNAKKILRIIKKEAKIRG